MKQANDFLNKKVRLEGDVIVSPVGHKCKEREARGDSASTVKPRFKIFWQAHELSYGTHLSVLEYRFGLY